MESEASEADLKQNPKQHAAAYDCTDWKKLAKTLQTQVGLQPQGTACIRRLLSLATLLGIEQLLETRVDSQGGGDVPLLVPSSVTITSDLFDLLTMRESMHDDARRELLASARGLANVTPKVWHLIGGRYYFEVGKRLPPKGNGRLVRLPKQGQRTRPLQC